MLDSNPQRGGLLWDFGEVIKPWGVSPHGRVSVLREEVCSNSLTLPQREQAGVIHKAEHRPKPDAKSEAPGSSQASGTATDKVLLCMSALT